MRVGVIGPIGPDYFAENVMDALPRVGAEGVALGAAFPRSSNRYVASAATLAVRASRSLDERLQRSLVRKAKLREVDLIVSVDSALQPATVEAITREGIKVVLWYPDAVANFGRQLLLLAPYDRVYIKEPLVVPRLRDLLGLPVSYLPEACNPARHRPIGVPHSERVVVVAGNMYPSRVILLNRLVSDGVPLRLYGAPVAPWIGDQPGLQGHTGRYIAREEKARVFREAAAVLNNLHPAEFDGVNCRLFEATASGAAVLAEWRPSLDELFEADEELFAFRSYDELLAQVRLLLDDPRIGPTRGDRASLRAHRDHSYEVRLRHILEDVAP